MPEDTVINPATEQALARLLRRFAAEVDAHADELAALEVAGWGTRSTDEVFGPVVTVTPFEDEADAITIASDTPYGLSGSIWTENVGRAIRVARAVQTGLGPDALDSLTEVKNVFIAS